MKIAVINSSAPGSVTEFAARTVIETLSELGDEIVHINLNKIELPFYGSVAEQRKEAVGIIKNAISEAINAAGVVFAASSLLGGMNAPMKAFIEYFQAPEFHHALLDKNCMLVSASENRFADGRETLESLSVVVQSLGGFDCVRAFIPGHAADDEDAKHLIEKQAEDFYRVLRQNRRYFPIITFAAANEQGAKEPAVSLFSSDVSVIQIKERAESREMTEEQKEDVNAISGYVTRKIETPREAKPSPTAVLAPKVKTCKQLTASLPHYFNPQLAAGIRTVICVNISGRETFSAAITIDGANCYHDELAPDGRGAEDAEMLINADADTWTEVLTGKLSAQKAFMVGKLKVRGNFLLLSKMDQLFSKMEA